MSDTIEDDQEEDLPDDFDPSEEAKSLIRRVQKYYEVYGNECGGSLHIVLDDGNIEDDHILFCQEGAKEREDILGEKIAESLLKLSMRDRQWIYEENYSFEK